MGALQRVVWDRGGTGGMVSLSRVVWDRDGDRRDGFTPKGCLG